LSHLNRPGGDPERGFFVIGRSEFTGCKPRACQALCRWSPLVSAVGSRGLDRHADHGAHAPSGALPRNGPSAGHHTRPSWSGTTCAPRAQLTLVSITMLCFRNFVDAKSRIRRKKRSKSLAALGKEFSRDFAECATLAFPTNVAGGNLGGIGKTKRTDYTSPD
jgi:hypothetical protein